MAVSQIDEAGELPMQFGRGCSRSPREPVGQPFKDSRTRFHQGSRSSVGSDGLSCWFRLSGSVPAAVRYAFAVILISSADK